jgi:hypothetical protein
MLTIEGGFIAFRIRFLPRLISFLFDVRAFLLRPSTIPAADLQQIKCMVVTGFGEQFSPLFQVDLW